MQQNFLEKAKQAKNPEDLMQIARENGVQLDLQQAEQYFNQLHTSGELADDELDAVAGGGCVTSVGGEDKIVVTSGCKCFTGKYEPAVSDFDPGTGMYLLKSGAEKRLFGWVDFGADGCCGWCMHLGYKGGTGYCKASHHFT